jgi:hypothetical protein
MVDDFMKRCVICGDSTTRPFAAAIEHFRPIDWPQRHFIKGNFKMFGLKIGLRANITLMFPWANTILHWKYRKHGLEIGE